MASRRADPKIAIRADLAMLVRNLYLSFDPALKGLMENSGGYAAPTAIGEVMRGGAQP